MSDIIEKLEYLNETKETIKDAIIGKGVEITDNATFRDYANKIKEIKQKPPTQEKSVTITSNTTTTVTPNDGYALSKVTAVTSIPASAVTNCVKIFGTSGTISDGINHTESGSATLPANKKGYVICVGTSTGDIVWTISPYTSVTTPVNQINNYNNSIYIANVAKIFTINPSTSSRTITGKATSSNAQARHLFAFLVY